MCAGTAVLRSHDCLRKPYSSRCNTNNNKNPNVSGSRRQKWSPTGFRSNVPDRSRKSPPIPTPTSAVASGAKGNLVMGQVKILKRGDPLPPGNKKVTPTASFKEEEVEDDLILCSTGRLGPEPEMVQKQIRASDFYAGSGPTVASPPPSSLPFPAFFSKKEKKIIDEATTDLLRLLRLDLAPHASLPFN